MKDATRLRNLRSWVSARYRAHDRDGWLRRTARSVAGRIDRLEHRGWADIDTNGERALLRALACHTEVATVVDVGANVGAWYREARDAFPEAWIVCVEIAPPLWPGLEQLLAPDPRAELARYGLGDADRDVELRWYPDRPALTTTVAFPHVGPKPELVPAPVRTVDFFLRDHGLERIDVVKIDIEGMEMPVVGGLVPLMHAGRIGVVQFEYGRANILTRSLLHDYARLAEEVGYLLGRLRPRGVELRPYELHDETFEARLMVLVRPDLADAVRSFSFGQAPSSR